MASFTNISLAFMEVINICFHCFTDHKATVSSADYQKTGNTRAVKVSFDIISTTDNILERSP